MTNIKEIALRIINQESRFRIGLPAKLTQDFATALLAELSKDAEPVAVVFAKCGGETLITTDLPLGTKLYPHPQPVEAIEAERGMTVIDKADDDALRFIRRVLESDAPEEDREAARKMIDDIRGRVRNVNSIEAIEQRVAEACAAYIRSQGIGFADDDEELNRIASEIDDGKWKEFVNNGSAGKEVK